MLYPNPQRFLMSILEPGLKSKSLVMSRMLEPKTQVINEDNGPISENDISIDMDEPADNIKQGSQVKKEEKIKNEEPKPDINKQENLKKDKETSLKT